MLKQRIEFEDMFHIDENHNYSTKVSIDMDGVIVGPGATFKDEINKYDLRPFIGKVLLVSVDKGIYKILEVYN